MNRVWPRDGSLEGHLSEFPSVLLVRHPRTGSWQFYERYLNSSDWDAERLVQAIDLEWSARGEARWPETRWWLSPTAPHLFDETSRFPGSWIREYLARRELWRHGGADRLYGSLEAREAAREAERRRDMHRENLGRAEDARRPARDAMPTGMSGTEALKEIRRNEGRPEIVY